MHVQRLRNGMRSALVAAVLGIAAGPALAFEPVKEVPPPEPVEPDPEGLHQPVITLKGVGPKFQEQLAALGADSAR